MPTRLDRWMRSKLWATTALTPSRQVPFAAQSRDEPVPYSWPAKITSGVWSFSEQDQRAWNGIQNTPSDIDLLSNYLVRELKRAIRKQKLTQASLEAA